MYPIDDRVVDCRMRGMSPPSQYVGRGERLLSQTMLWLILGGRTNHSCVTQRLTEAGCDGLMHSPWVALGHTLAISFGLFMNVLAPHGDADW
jgi:hypothetical protein